MAVLVGSRALEFWVDGFTCRPDADIDLIVEPEEKEHYNSLPNVDAHSTEELNNHIMCLQYVRGLGDEQVIPGVGICNVMSMQGLAVMKRSHLWRERNFDKHITMYHKHLEKHLNYSSLELGILEERTKLSYELFGNRHPNLNQSNKDFFDDKVVKKFDHDWIHELVAYYDRPLFERLKHRGEEQSAWCAKDLWFRLPERDKTRCVAEEAHVIACERFMIPNDWQYSSKKAYYQAVRKVCTTLCSGWFRDWAIDHFPEVLEHYSETKFNYVWYKVNESQKKEQTT